MKQSVLIVDDEPRNQRIIAETLEDVVPFEVASSAEEALKKVETLVPDLILLDIMMPGLDGYEVCRRIRSKPELALTKIILVSGKAMLEERLKGYEVGADDYMTKPFSPEELLAKVKVFLRLTQVEKELSELNRSLDQRVHDRTQQLLEAEGKLVNAAKMSALGEMAGGIAHEINTPLGSIRLLTELLTDLIEKDPIDRKAAIERAQQISKTVGKISAIIDGLLTFSREGARDPMMPASLREIVESTMTLCTERLKHESVRVEIAPIPAELNIQCRAVQISQVLLNLISNSCDAISGHPEKWIKIAVERHGNEVELSVTDSGSGIPEDVRNKIFQPFFTTKDIGKGTGLGLSISKGILDAHHGKLRIDEASKNTRFVLTLPASF